MTENLVTADGYGVEVAPELCTLPTVEMPVRLAEWDRLFESATKWSQRTGPLGARFILRADAEVAAWAANLCVRETQCCDFFVFGLTVAGGNLSLDVSTPAGQAAVLDALLERARRAVPAGPQ